MEKEILPANKEYRRKFIVRITVLCIVALVLGCVLILWGHPWMKRYLETLEPRRGLRLITWSLALIFLSILPICVFIFLQGRKIMRSERFPPPGTKVIRDTEVIRGERAIARGRLLVGAALVLACLALVAAVYVPYWLNKLAATQKRFQKPAGHGQLV
jgi:hypothetical protein